MFSTFPEYKEAVDCNCAMCGTFLSEDRNPTHELKAGQVCEDCFDKHVKNEQLESLMSISKYHEMKRLKDLFNRIRPNVEVAPWVYEELKSILEIK